MRDLAVLEKKSTLMSQETETEIKGEGGHATGVVGLSSIGRIVSRNRGFVLSHKVQD